MPNLSYSHFSARSLSKDSDEEDSVAKKEMRFHNIQLERKRFGKLRKEISQRQFILHELKTKYPMIVNVDFAMLVESTLPELKEIYEACKLHSKMNEAALRI